MQNYSFDPCSHFRYTSDQGASLVRQILATAITSAVASGSPSFPQSLSRDDINTLWQFCQELEVGYIHPRRSSHFVRLMSSRHAVLRPVMAERKRYGIHPCTAMPLTKKNLTNHPKAV